MSTMLSPDSGESQKSKPGWRANDMHLRDVAPLLDKFAARYDLGASDECWMWRGTVMANGYGGLCRTRLSALMAHRVAWVAATGLSLTNGMTIDHLCNQPLCVNPAHLEPVTLKENVRRKNERLGNRMGGGHHVSASGKRLRVPTEEQKERNRETALAYYYANRERVLARCAEPVECVHCGASLVRGSLRGHIKRLHPQAA